jgi:hypothetical protein
VEVERDDGVGAVARELAQRGELHRPSALQQQADIRRVRVRPAGTDVCQDRSEALQQQVVVAAADGELGERLQAREVALNEPEEVLKHLALGAGDELALDQTAPGGDQVSPAQLRAGWIDTPGGLADRDLARLALAEAAVELRLDHDRKVVLVADDPVEDGSAI